VFSPPTQGASPARADDSFDADALLTAIRGADWPGDALVLKDRPDGTVCRRTLVARDLVFKTEPVSSPYRRLQVRFGLSRGRRTWDGACWLMDQGIKTARPLALIDGHTDAGQVECLVLEVIEGVTLLQHLADEPDSDRTRNIAETVGRDLATIFLAGRYNRDHKPSNMIVDPQAPHVTIIDTIAIRPIAPGFEPLERMLASLVLEPSALGVPGSWDFIGRVTHAASKAILQPSSGITPETYADRLLERVRRRVESHTGSAPRHESVG